MPVRFFVKKDLAFQDDWSYYRETMKQQDEKRLHIIRKGLKALYLKGYNATGVKEITDASDIPKGSFYNHFKSKEDFAIETMSYFLDRELEVMAEVLNDTSRSPLERIEDLYRYKIDNFVRQGSFSLGCYLCNMTLEMADVSEPIAKAASKMLEREYAPVLDCLREALDTGELDASCDVNELSDLIRNSWLGALIIMKANKSPEPLYAFRKLLRQHILK